MERTGAVESRRVPPQFRIFVQGRGGAFSMQCFGDLDMATIGRVRHALEGCLALMPLELHLDWTGLTFMGIDGARLLDEVRQGCASRGIPFRASLSPSAERVDRLVRSALEHVDASPRVPTLH